MKKTIQAGRDALAARLRGLSFDLAAVGLTLLFLLGMAATCRYSRVLTQPWQVTVSQQGQTADTVEQVSLSKLLEGERIDLNTASAAELERLPGIGEKRAQAIVDWRAEHGPFASPEELTQVPGIGEGLLEQIRDNITAEG